MTEAQSPAARKGAGKPPIEDIAKRYAARYAVVAVQAEEPVGAARLPSLTRSAALASVRD